MVVPFLWHSLTLSADVCIYSLMQMFSERDANATVCPLCLPLGRSEFTRNHILNLSTLTVSLNLVRFGGAALKLFAVGKGRLKCVPEPINTFFSHRKLLSGFLFVFAHYRRFLSRKNTADEGEKHFHRFPLSALLLRCPWARHQTPTYM